MHLSPLTNESEESEDEEDIQPAELSEQVQIFLEHLQKQEEWVDTEWLPGDLTKIKKKK
jgi:hypothetical protein